MKRSSELELADCFCRVHDRINQLVPVWLTQGLLKALLGRLPIGQSSFQFSLSGLGKPQTQCPTIGSRLCAQPPPAAKQSEGAGEGCAVDAQEFSQLFLRHSGRQLQGLEQGELGSRDSCGP